MAAAADKILTDEQLAFYDDNGYLVIEGLFSPEEMEKLRTAIGGVVDGLDVASHPRTVFSAGDKQTKDRDEYFLSSGGNVSFFFEEDAFDEEGKLKKDKSESLNKIGHALHELVPEFKEFSFDERIEKVSKQLLSRPVIMQSMYIFKHAGTGGAVPQHQDATFLIVTPDESAFGLWFAIDDADEENACLWAAPGSHKDEITQRFMRADPPTTPQTTVMEGEAQAEVPHENYVALPAKSGTVVVIHPKVLHKSFGNDSDRNRNAYTLHLIDADAELHPRNWLKSEIGFNGWGGDHVVSVES